MENNSFEDWLDKNLSRFQNLTEAVITIANSLLSEANVPYLSVSGRTKAKNSCLEKGRRKSYKQPHAQMTDISGIRIILYYEDDVERVTSIIENAFNVDKKNSMNRDDLLKTNEFSYRSIHFVCDLGVDRHKLPEFVSYRDLKFEFQVRTVLQHAWAELSHDRNYKFSGKLPREMERKMFLFAGMLEMVDAGFAELSQQIDHYISEVSSSSAKGSLNIDLNSLSLRQFMDQWADTNKLPRDQNYDSEGYKELLRELKEFGIKTLDRLNGIIPNGYADEIRDQDVGIYGTVRDWMIISDPEMFLSNVEANWILLESDIDMYRSHLTEEQLDRLVRKVGVEPNLPDMDE